MHEKSIQEVTKPKKQMAAVASNLKVGKKRNVASISHSTYQAIQS
jgi:hypothetical protein